MKAGEEKFMLPSCQQLDNDAEKHRLSPWRRAGVSQSPPTGGEKAGRAVSAAAQQQTRDDVIKKLLLLRHS